MEIMEQALRMMERYPLCDHCLGRQFALLGYGVENDERGRSIKLALVLDAQASCPSDSREAVKVLKILAANGLSKVAQNTIRKIKKRIRGVDLHKTCFLCGNGFDKIEIVSKKAQLLLEAYEYNNFLVGIELPVDCEEREDEFKAEFGTVYGENMRNEFGRLIGKRIAEINAKPVEFSKPEVVVLVNPYSETARLQVNSLFVAGRYKKLVRGIPQSKWFCSSCRGKGCEKCDWTGKMYSESVEEIIAKPFLDATSGSGSLFHASGREDIDARMLGSGRPFVIQILKPRKRFLDLRKLQKAVNACGIGKIEVANLRFADKDFVRRLKIGESSQKKYRIVIEFESKIVANDLRLLKKKLTNLRVSQKTPVRVLHRRADLTREKYIYDVNIKKLAPKKAEMLIRCQGGLYVKELVTGDGGRTTPNITEILKNKARPMKLDVLSVIMGNRGVRK